MLRQTALVGAIVVLCAVAGAGEVLHSTQQVRNSYDSADFNCIVFDTQAQVADDFTVPFRQVWSIEQVVVDYLGFGFTGPGQALVEFFADAGGKPADEAMASVLVSGPGIEHFSDFVFGLVGMRLTADLTSGPPVELEAGHYWITMQPVSPDTFYSIRDAGLAIRDDAHARDVSGFPHYGHTTWEPLGGSMSVGLLGTSTGCTADFNGDGVVDTRDVIAFLNAWNAREPSADINGDGTVDTRDVIAFLNLWNAGC